VLIAGPGRWRSRQKLGSSHRTLPMTRFLSAFRAAATVAVLAAAGVCSAASSPITDQMLAPLVHEYARAVKPGEQADFNRELLGVVLRRGHRGDWRRGARPLLGS